METDPIKAIFNSLHDHSKLIQAGVPNDQALRICFGDDIAERAINQVSDVLLEEDQKRQDELAKYFFS